MPDHRQCRRKAHRNQLAKNIALFQWPAAGQIPDFAGTRTKQPSSSDGSVLDEAAAASLIRRHPSVAGCPPHAALPP